MLLELRIKNFIIIDQVSISFKPGFNVLSGETGSGKSVLLKSLAVLMGAPSSNDFIGTYGDESYVEGYFDLTERKDIKNRLKTLGLDSNEDIFIVRRIIGKKNRVFINGSLVTLSELKNLVTPMLEVAGPNIAPLMEMTGQHDTKQLLSTSYHRFLLDLYCNLNEKLESYKESFKLRENLVEEIKLLESKSQEREHQLAFLKFQSEELESFGLNLEEDTELQNKIFQLKNKQKLTEFIQKSSFLLSESDQAVLSNLHKVIKSAENYEANNSKIASCNEQLRTAKSIIEDVSFEISNLNSISESPNEDIDALTARYTKLRSFQKKYGDDLQKTLDAEQQLKQEISTLENLDSVLEEKNIELKKIESELLKTASQMHDIRLNSSHTIVKKVNEQLQDLNMKGVHFFIGIEKTNELNKYGNSKVEFLVQNHKDSEKRALAKTASGGELSRILLSIKTILGENEWPRTYLFDEVDTGVSGPTAQLVGRKLKELSFDQQVLCVTHLPQVAAQANTHFVIEKIVSKDSVEMQVKELKPDERVDEIARLISGEKISDSSREHARKLLEL